MGGCISSNTSSAPKDNPHTPPKIYANNNDNKIPNPVVEQPQSSSANKDGQQSKSK